MRSVTVGVLALVLVLASGCAAISHQSPQYGVRANTNGQVGTLYGTSTSHYLLWGLMAWGDASVATAAKNSRGKYIRTVDQNTFCFLGLYGRNTTIVTTENTPP